MQRVSTVEGKNTREMPTEDGELPENEKEEGAWERPRKEHKKRGHPPFLGCRRRAGLLMPLKPGAPNLRPVNLPQRQAYSALSHGYPP